MSTAVIAFAPIPDTPLPTGATFSGSYRFSIVNPADGSAVQSKDSTDTTVTFTGLPEVPLLLKVQSVGTDGALFNDASVQQFSGVPPAPAPTVYAAPGALTITVSPDAQAMLCRFLDWLCRKLRCRPPQRTYRAPGPIAIVVVKD